MIVARLPAGTTVVHIRIHVPRPELSKVFGVEVGPIEREARIIGSCTALSHLLHLAVLEMLLVRMISVLTSGGERRSWCRNVLEDCNGTT